MSGSPSTALPLAIATLEALPAFIKDGQDVTAIVIATAISLRQMQAENRDPTAQEWSAISGAIASMTAKIAKAAGMAAVV